MVSLVGMVSTLVKVRISRTRALRALVREILTLTRVKTIPTWLPIRERDIPVFLFTMVSMYELIDHNCIPLLQCIG